MNFFEHQDRARRKTTKLVVLFVLAVIMILIAVNAAAFGIARLVGAYEGFRRDAAPAFREDLRYPGRLTESVAPGPLPLFVGTTLVTLLVIGGGSLYKIALLSRGGPAVAQMLGGRPLRPEGGSPPEKMLQNIVEEMSIASGVPMPRVYVLDHEEGINAFAAGFTNDDAVIGVTRGTIEKLNRDELQGVIAHEFSHILHGDMRLNLRLIGILNGILVIALIGYMIVRVIPYSSSGRSRDSKDNALPFIVIMALAGAGMIVIGWIGVFFGRLIQAAVSRQREFLADASAVQFTRNASGLVGALKKIGKYSAGSRVENAHALETAHLFFGSAFKVGFTNSLATHPPLTERIRAIDPTFDGSFEIGPGTTQVLDETPTIDRGEMLADMVRSAMAPSARRIDPRSVAERAGTVSPRQITFASELIDVFPPDIQEAVHDPFSSQALVFSLFASADDQMMQKQLSLVQGNVEPECFESLLRLLPILRSLGPGSRLPLLDLTLPALRAMSPPQRERLRAIIRAMIEADGRITLFEYALNRIIDKQLAPERTRREPIEYFSVSAVRKEAAVLLSSLAAASTAETGRAFQAGASELDPENPPQMTDINRLGEIDAAMKRLARSSPPVKKRLIDAMSRTVAADGQVNVAEAELLRATAATLDVPIPPLLTMQN